MWQVIWDRTEKNSEGLDKDKKEQDNMVEEDAIAEQTRLNYIEQAAQYAEEERQIKESVKNKKTGDKNGG